MDDLTAKKLEQAKESSDRARWVLLVMEIACVVVFMAAWHEWPTGWTSARIRTAQAAAWYLDCQPNGHSEPVSRGSSFDTDQTRDECQIERDGNKTPFTADEITRAKAFLLIKDFSPVQARKNLEDLEASLIARTMTVTVPFLGITLDINDLGFLGGTTFVILLMWLLYSLRREAENLEILFAPASGEDLHAIYQVLSMTQLLTIPPRTKRKERRIEEYAWNLVWDFPAKLLFLMPLGVQFFCAQHRQRNTQERRGGQPGSSHT